MTRSSAQSKESQESQDSKRTRSDPRRAIAAIGLVALLALVGPGSAFADAPPELEAGADLEFEPEVIDMSPSDGPISFSMRNILAPFSTLFRGTDYHYKTREVLVETTPAGGLVDLFYVRKGFQKRFEQAETPVTVILPPRIDAHERDVFTVRAFREGYRQSSVDVKVNQSGTEIVVDLEPLPNLLSHFASRYFAARASLVFLTEEALTHRVQKTDTGFAIILIETGLGDGISDQLEDTRDPLIGGLYGQQLGEDLMVSVDLTELSQSGAIEPRTRQMFDAARDLHSFSVDLVPTDGGAEAIARARAALPKLTESDVLGCASSFDRALREQLDEGSLNRALNPQGSLTGPYVRAAMRRLGELTPEGKVHFGDGSVYRPSVPIELEMALTQAGDAKGFLALLRRFTALIEGDEFARETFRSLIAPEMSMSRFGPLVEEAEGRESSCMASL